MKNEIPEPTKHPRLEAFAGVILGAAAATVFALVFWGVIFAIDFFAAGGF